MGQYLYGCRTRWSDGPPHDAPKSEEEAVARIDELYASGIPFFSKESIRAVLKQIQSLSALGDKILVKGVDGAMVEFEINVGGIHQTRSLEDDDLEIELIK